FDLFFIWSRGRVRSLAECRRLQIFDNECLCLFCLQVDDTDRMIVRIGDEEFLTGYGQTAGFIKRRLRAVALTRLACAREALDVARGRIEDLDFVIVRVGYQQLVIPARQPERMLQSDIGSVPILISKIKQIATHERAYLALGAEIDGANDVGFGIGNKQRLAVRSEEHTSE